jgi:hypothetical protein
MTLMVAVPPDAGTVPPPFKLTPHRASELGAVDVAVDEPQAVVTASRPRRVAVGNGRSKCLDIDEDATAEWSIASQVFSKTLPLPTGAAAGRRFRIV